MTERQALEEIVKKINTGKSDTKELLAIAMMGLDETIQTVLFEKPDQVKTGVLKLAKQDLSKEIAAYNEIVAQLKQGSDKDIWIGIRDYIKQNKPQFIEPYADSWNIWVAYYRLDIPSIVKINPTRQAKFKSRIKDPEFDFLKILEKVTKSDTLKGLSGKWKVSWDWIWENESNYLKILEGNYN